MDDKVKDLFLFCSSASLRVLILTIAPQQILSPYHDQDDRDNTYQSSEFGAQSSANNSNFSHLVLKGLYYHTRKGAAVLKFTAVYLWMLSTVE